MIVPANASQRVTIVVVDDEPDVMEIAAERSRQRCSILI